MSIGTCQECGATGEGWDPSVRVHVPGGGRIHRADEMCPGSLRKSVEESKRTPPKGVRVSLRDFR